MAKYIRTLTVYTNLEIQQKEVPLFRGAVLNVLGDKANLLFHNHVGDDQFRYSYPLIQYKRLGGKAAIVCIGDGIEPVGQILSDIPNKLIIGTHDKECNIEHIDTKEYPVSINKEFSFYHLRHWLPLNSSNYAQFVSAENFVEKIQILERVLIGNILSFLKGVGIYLEDQIELNITNIINQRPTFYKKVRLMTFDIEFKTNITLPPYVGIGKNASIGYGILSLA